MKKLSLYLILMACSVSTEIYASSKITVEDAALSNIRSAILMFEQLRGYSPSNWAQINEVLDLNKINEQSLIKSPAYPLHEHYVFVTNKIPMLGYERGDVILIRTAPVEEADRTSPGRYVISRNREGFQSLWLAETNVQKMLMDAGITELPQPEPWTPTNTSRSATSVDTQRREVGAVPQAYSAATERPGARPSTDAQTAAIVTPQAENSKESSSPMTWLFIPVIVIAGSAFAFVLLRQSKRKN